MMANASKDPIWKAKVASELVRNPKLKSIIEEKCATCHMPMAMTQAKFEGSAVEIGGRDIYMHRTPFMRVPWMASPAHSVIRFRAAISGQKKAFRGTTT